MFKILNPKLNLKTNTKRHKRETKTVLFQDVRRSNIKTTINRVGRSTRGNMKILMFLEDYDKQFSLETGVD